MKTQQKSKQDIAKHKKVKKERKRKINICNNANKTILMDGHVEKTDQKAVNNMRRKFKEQIRCIDQNNELNEQKCQTSFRKSQQNVKFSHKVFRIYRRASQCHQKFFKQNQELFFLRQRLIERYIKIKDSFERKNITKLVTETILKVAYFCSQNSSPTNFSKRQVSMAKKTPILDEQQKLISKIVYLARQKDQKIKQKQEWKYKFARCIEESVKNIIQSKLCISQSLKESIEVEDCWQLHKNLSIMKNHEFCLNLRPNQSSLSQKRLKFTQSMSQKMNQMKNFMELKQQKLKNNRETKKQMLKTHIVTNFQKQGDKVIPQDQEQVLDNSYSPQFSEQIFNYESKGQKNNKLPQLWNDQICEHWQFWSSLRSGQVMEGK